MPQSADHPSGRKLIGCDDVVHAEDGPGGSGSDRQARDASGGTGPSRWGWLGRADTGSPTRVFAPTLAFAVVAAASLVVSGLAERPPSLVALVALMMVALGLGEVTGRPRYVVAARISALTIFVGLCVVAASQWL